MFEFIKKMFIRLSMSIPCQSRATVMDINSSEPLYYPWSCDAIVDPYVRICVPNKSKKNMNEKEFNLMKQDF